MKAHKCILTSTVALLFLFFQPAWATRGISITAKDGTKLIPFQDSWAVVIGIDQYQRLKKLKLAVADAKGVQEMLVSGFNFETDKVFTLFDEEATKRNILALLGDEIPYKVGEDDRLFVYFAGHGETRDETGYLLPVDARQGRYRSTAISMNELKDILRDIKCKHIYLVLDACYSGMFFSTRAATVKEAHPRYLYEITRRKAWQALTAGGKEPVTDSGYRDHSVFTGFFIEALERRIADYNGDGIITASEISAYVLPQVADLSEQTPEYGQLPGSEGGEFIFIARSSGAQIIRPSPGQEPKTTLAVTANIESATVTLNGAEMGMTPLTLDTIAPGHYLLKVSREGYQPYEERVEVGKGQTLRLHALLEPKPTTGSIEVSGSPERARVYLDGYYSGRLPCTIERVEPGRHTLIVKKLGHKDWKEKVRVAAGERAHLEANLEKALKRAPKPWPGAKGFKNSMEMEFVLIPAGEFDMGSPRSERDRERDERQHKVTISTPFYMQTTEVTQGHWEEVMGDNPSYFNDCGEDCPVERVSWDECQEFIRRLNGMEGTDKYRLPTEAEWEYACRAGSLTRYCFRDDYSRLGEYAWYFDNSGEQPHRVGQKKPNAWGLYDMHGNVWEWCQDWYKKRYPRGHASDPKGSSSGSHRVKRGGSWDAIAWNCRSANRSAGLPFHSSYILGFRLVISPD